MSKMHAPQEIQERIIDILAENVTKATKKEALKLRLVCRAWIPRVDFHLFRRIRLEAAQGPALLSVVKSSRFSIGSFIRFLFVYGYESLRDRSRFSYHNDETALQQYLTDLIEALPHLETLAISSLFPDQIAWIPCFPTIRSLSLMDVSVWPSQLIRLISTAKSLERFRDGNCDPYEEGSLQPPEEGGRQPHSSSLSSVCLENLKQYETRLYGGNVNVLLHSYLFPLDVEPKLSSLSRLGLKGIRPDTMRKVIHILNATSQSLQFLQLWFDQTYDEDEESYEQSFDFSGFEKLGYIRFVCIGHHTPTRINELGAIIAAVESLSKHSTNLTISLFFRQDWTVYGEFIQRMDSLLETKSGVSKVEIAAWSARDQEEIRQAFPKLLAKKKLSVVGDWSEALDILPI